MSLGTSIFTLIFGELVGRDEFGNRYYRDRRTRKGRERRWVIYNGKAEASKVPPLWHGWLHATLVNPPTEPSARRYLWQKPHLPNMTGTSLAYKPPGRRASKGTKDKLGFRYQAWNPDQTQATKGL